MKIIGISASARKNKSTHFLLDQCLNECKSTAELQGRSLDVELIDLAPLRFNGCIACGKCKKGVLCSQDDDFQPLIAKLADPEVQGISLSPAGLAALDEGWIDWRFNQAVRITDKDKWFRVDVNTRLLNDPD